MKLDFGSPLEPGKEDGLKRLQVLEEIHPINFKNGLDLGAGKGAYSFLLSSKVEKLFCTDLQTEYVHGISLNGNKNIFPFVSFAQNIPLASESLESVFCIEVLDHVEDLAGTISEIKRITKHGGFVFVSVPNKYFPFETHHVYFGKKRFDGRIVPFICMFDLIHKRIGSARRFSRKKLAKLFTEQDFALIGYNYFSLPFDNFKLGRLLIKPLTEFLLKTPFKIFSPTLTAVFNKM